MDARTSTTEGTPFATVLDAALTRSRLSLHRVSARVGERGVRMSPSTLSLWRRAKARPSARSREVLSALDEVLALERGSLEGALGGPTVGTVEWWRMSTPPAEALLHSSLLEWAVRDWELGDDDGLRHLVVRDVVEIDDRRRVASHRVSRAVTAERDTDRSLAFHVRDGVDADGDPCVPVVTETTGMTTGRRALRREDGLSITELHLDLPMTKGETRLLEHLAVSHPSPAEVPAGSQDQHEGRTTHPLGLLVLEVVFAQGCLPVRAWSELLPDGEQVELDPSGGVLSASVTGARSGGVRIGWEWP